MSDYIYYSNINGVDLLIGNFFYVKKEKGVCYSVFRNSLTNGYFLTDEFKNRVHEIFSKYSNAYSSKEQIVEIPCTFTVCPIYESRSFKSLRVYRGKEQVSYVHLPDIRNIDNAIDKPLMYYRLTAAIRYFTEHSNNFNFPQIHRSIFGNITINNVPFHAFKTYDIDALKINICEIKLTYSEFVEQYKSGLLLARLEGKLKKVKI